MRITPLDIQQKQFPLRWIRGFNVEEVYSFLEIVREEMEDLLRENASAKEKLIMAESQLLQYKAMEATLKDTISTAQQMAEAFSSNARKEADLLRRDTEIAAENMLKTARERVNLINEEILDLKGIRRHFKEELKRLIDTTKSTLAYDDVRENHCELEVERR